MFEPVMNTPPSVQQDSYGGDAPVAPPTMRRGRGSFDNADDFQRFTGIRQTMPAAPSAVATAPAMRSSFMDAMRSKVTPATPPNDAAEYAQSWNDSHGL